MSEPVVVHEWETTGDTGFRWQFQVRRSGDVYRAFVRSERHDWEEDRGLGDALCELARLATDRERLEERVKELETELRDLADWADDVTHGPIFQAAGVVWGEGSPKPIFRARAALEARAD